MVFNHSIKLPTQYKRTAAIFKKAISENISLKTLIYQEKHARIPNLQALLRKYSDNRGVIESAIEKTKILEENPRLDPSLCRVLVTELLFGTKNLKSEAKPVTVVKSYHDKLLEIVGEGNSSGSTSAGQEKALTPRYVRINTNLVTMEETFELLENEGWEKVDKVFDDYDEFLAAVKSLTDKDYIVDMHVPGLLLFHASSKNYWAQHEYVKTKKFMLQDKGTCLVAGLLDPPPNSVVLDMCAAPGMKTIHLSNVMQNKGTIYAVEQNCNRYQTLRKMVSDAEANIVEPIQADALAITNAEAPNVEYVLVDPSCSGSGMTNRLTLHDGGMRDESERLYKLQGIQIKILRHALKNFPKVKRVAYCTCSLNEQENEQVVEKVLSQCPDFKLLSAKKSLRNKWKNTGNNSYKKVGKNCLYTRPEDDLTSGIFIAIFEKVADSAAE